MQLMFLCEEILRRLLDAFQTGKIQLEKECFLPSLFLQLLNCRTGRLRVTRCNVDFGVMVE